MEQEITKLEEVIEGYEAEYKVAITEDDRDHLLGLIVSTDNILHDKMDAQHQMLQSRRGKQHQTSIL